MKNFTSIGIHLCSSFPEELNVMSYTGAQAGYSEKRVRTSFLCLNATGFIRYYGVLLKVYGVLGISAQFWRALFRFSQFKE